MDKTVFSEQFFSKFSDILGPYLSTVGIPSSVRADPTVLVTVPQFVEVLEVASRAQSDNCLGLHIGERMRAPDLGVLGYAIKHAATLELLLHTYVNYFAVYAYGMDMRMQIDDNRVSVIIHLADSTIIARQQDSELALAFLHTVIKDNLQGDWRIQEVHFEHEKPADISEHHRIFNAPLCFNKPFNAIIFDKMLLSRPLKEADQRIFPLLQRHLDSIMEERAEENDLVLRVSNIIAKSLSIRAPSLSEVAEKVGVPSWTLQRRLRDEGLLYRQLVLNTRRRVALSYIKDTSIPLTEVAFLLGYSETSAFSRAFRRWTGQAPIDYRRSFQSDHCSVISETNVLQLSS